jgi:hypothetical protein
MCRREGRYIRRPHLLCSDTSADARADDDASAYARPDTSADASANDDASAYARSDLCAYACANDDASAYARADLRADLQADARADDDAGADARADEDAGADSSADDHTGADARTNVGTHPAACVRTYACAIVARSDVRADSHRWRRCGQPLPIKWRGLRVVLRRLPARDQGRRIRLLQSRGVRVFGGHVRI